MIITIAIDSGTPTSETMAKAIAMAVLRALKVYAAFKTSGVREVKPARIPVGLK